MASPQRLLDPDTIALRAGREANFLHLPEPATLFGERAMRLRQLATDHAMGDYLRFAAEVCLAQHDEARQGPAPAVPSAEPFEQAATQGVPPLPASGWLADGAWRNTLRSLLQRLSTRLEAGPAQATVRQLSAAPDPELDALARALLHEHLPPDALAAAPFVAAALQVHGARLVAAAAKVHAALPAGAFGRIDDARVCPCCGSRPTAGVQRLGTEASGQRYLHCSMCAAQWHLVRITCAHCGNHEGLTYEQLQAVGSDAAPRNAIVRAECCPRCHNYLKQVAQDHDPNAEAVADDLASVALDVLLGEAGWQRLGVNAFLLFGDADEAPPP
jgi:FdhE protein